MKRFSIVLLGCIAFLLLVSLSCSTHNQRDRYVVVLSMDGFRADYPDRAYTPTLDSLAAVGVRATFRPSFPSVTFPNHYSMATGLHPDHHGLVNNFFYAPDLDSIYRMADPTPGFMEESPSGIQQKNKVSVQLLSIGLVANIRSRDANRLSGNLLIRKYLFPTVPIRSYPGCNCPKRNVPGW